MKKILPILTLGLSLVCSVASGKNSNPQVEDDIAKITNTPGDVQMLYFNKGFEDLVKMGIPAIEPLIPHLADTQLTQIHVESRFGDQGRQLAVNEIVAQAIARIAGHHFYIASGNDTVSTGDSQLFANPVLLKAYQDQIEHWCTIQGNMKESFRRLEDIGDGCHLNRFDAYEYFVKTGDPVGRARLTARVDMLISDPVPDSMKESELVACARALGSIDNKADLQVVKRIWDYLFGKEFYAYMTSGTDAVGVAKARIKLGDLEQTKKDLNTFDARHGSELEGSEFGDFQIELGKKK